MISRAVKAAEPLEVLLARVAEQACMLIGFDFGAVMLADPPRERLMVRGSYGLSEAYVDRLNTDVPLRVHAPEPGVDAPAARSTAASRRCHGSAPTRNCARCRERRRRYEPSSAPPLERGCQMSANKNPEDARLDFGAFGSVLSSSFSEWSSWQWP